MIKLIRLVSGEELIAEVDQSENDYAITIKDALVLIPAGEGKIGIMPFMPYTEAAKGLVIKTKFVMFMIDPVEDLKRQFTSAKTGLTLPNNGKIIS